MACGHVYHKRCIEHYAEVNQTTLEELPCPNCKLPAKALAAAGGDAAFARDETQTMAAGEGDAAFARDETQTMAAGQGDATSVFDNIMQLGAALPASAAGGGEGQQAAGGGQSEAMLPSAATTPGADEMHTEPATLEIGNALAQFQKNSAGTNASINAAEGICISAVSALNEAGQALRGR